MLPPPAHFKPLLHLIYIISSLPSPTYLCNLIQQFVVFLSFLQGAQIAAHSSCQGNAAAAAECV